VTRTPFYYRESEGVRVTVRPAYLPRHSREREGQYVFAYDVRIENVGPQAARLLARRWVIHDSIGEVTDVEGDGVLGEQPLIGPGRVHEYQSFCVLKSPSGWMEGQYLMERADGTPFAASVPRFDLNTDGTIRH
jgi:ApaG protein